MRAKALMLWVFFAVLRAASAAPTPPRHTVLYYTSSSPLTAANVRPLVGYVGTDGKARDWLFDGMIIYDIKLFQSATTPTATTIAAYEQALFDDGGLAQLAAAVAALRTELNDQSYRLKIYLTATCGTKDLHGVPYAEKLLDRYATLSLPELELVGMYWGAREDVIGVATNENQVKGTAPFIHQRGLELVWIPHATAALTGWQTLGFDRAALQVNYAFRDFPISQFRATDTKFRGDGLSGVELEFGPVRNPQIPGPDTELSSAKSYVSAGDMFNWTENRWNAYYHGTVIAGYATSTKMRATYDGLYRLIAAHPRQSAALRSERGAIADAWVEQAAGREGVKHGTGATLVFGTNTAPNALRTYIKFDLKNGPASPQLLAAHLVTSLRKFEYGSVIEDGQLYYVSDSSWSEGTLAANTQPAASTHAALNQHRFVTPPSFPARHAFDVYGKVRDALAAKAAQVSFLLRRYAEDPQQAEGILDSRETSSGPKLVLVYGPAAPTPPLADGGGPPGGDAAAAVVDGGAGAMEDGAGPAARDGRAQAGDGGVPSQAGDGQGDMDAAGGCGCGARGAGPGGTWLLVGVALLLPIAVRRRRGRLAR